MIMQTLSKDYYILQMTYKGPQSEFHRHMDEENMVTL